MRSIEGVKGLLSDQAADGGAQENDGEEGQANDGRGQADGAPPVTLAGGHPDAPIMSSPKHSPLHASLPHSAH